MHKLFLYALTKSHLMAAPVGGRASESRELLVEWQIHVLAKRGPTESNVIVFELNLKHHLLSLRSQSEIPVFCYRNRSSIDHF